MLQINMKNKYSNVIVVSNIKFSTKPMFKVSNICDLFGYLPTQISPVAVYMIQGPTTDQLKSSHYFQQSPRIKKLGIYCAFLWRDIRLTKITKCKILLLIINIYCSSEKAFIALQL
ncbi:unnamed protein product [Brassica napus]|uniref:(rape) hypothetical protein n=1 Tax=Brassica napus TaxID=3708 RepID=A0A816JZB7_BRANA|nr:unnamed protein product [Brassica napus]